MSECWQRQVVDSPVYFKNTVKNIVRDQFIQSWNSNIQESNKCLNYRIYKSDFVFEEYFKVLPANLAIVLCKFRCTNHKLPIEKGRFYNIDRPLRLCNLCDKNELGDEYHYLFNCDFFKNTRKKYIDNYYCQHPNCFKYESLMNSKDRTTLLKLAIFCKTILSTFI